MLSPIDVHYRIDGNDHVIFVDDGWSDVATRDAAPELASPHVLGRSLWSFVSDATTIQLYRQIISRVRDGRTARFSVRCDGPSARRVVELSIETTPQSTGHVDFRTRTISNVQRAWVPLLARDVVRSDDMVRSCSWCNRIEVRRGDWVDVEVATHRLRLFDREHQPQLTHGMCTACEVAMSLQLEALKRD
jgi:hypothetical protein